MGFIRGDDGRECIVLRPGETASLREIMDALKELPTIDLVPVVRCKDCQHCWADSNKKQRFDPMKHHWWYCDNLDMDNRMDAVPPEKWFCADGKRKEN